MEMDDGTGLGSAAQIPTRDPAAQDHVLADQILAVPIDEHAPLTVARILHEHRLAREKNLTSMLKKLSTTVLRAAANSRGLSAKLARVKTTRDLKIKDCDRLKEVVVSSGLMTRETMLAMLKNGTRDA